MVTEELKTDDWVIATSNSNHHSSSKWFNSNFDFEIGKAYQIQDIEQKDCIVFKLGNSSMRSYGCRKAEQHEIPIEYQENVLKNIELW